MMYVSFFGICVCFLEDGLRRLDGWEEMHFTLLMSFARLFQHADANSDSTKIDQNHLRLNNSSIVRLLARENGLIDYFGFLDHLFCKKSNIPRVPPINPTMVLIIVRKA